VIINPDEQLPKLHLSVKKGALVIRFPLEPLNAIVRATTLMQTGEFAEVANRVIKTGVAEVLDIPRYPEWGY